MSCLPSEPLGWVQAARADLVGKRDDIARSVDVDRGVERGRGLEVVDGGKMEEMTHAPLERLALRRRFDSQEPYFNDIRRRWSEGLRSVFQNIPDPDWKV